MRVPMNPAVPRSIPVPLDTLFPIPTLPTHLQRSLFISDAPYAFLTCPIQLRFPEHTTRTHSLPIRALLALPLS